MSKSGGIMNIIRNFVRMNRKYSKLLTNKYPRFFYSENYQAKLREKINSSIKGGANKILEVGGIDRPLLSKGTSYVYDGMDIEAKEECYKIYDNFIVQSIEQPIKNKYDLIISITLLEHVPDNKASFHSIYSSLTPGGQTHHYLPSKWHPYAIALRLVGPVIQKKLIPILRPGSEGVTGYPTYFSYCSIPAMKRLLVKEGFTDIDIKAFYRANDYFAFFTPLFLIVSMFENICRKLNLEIFASGFILSARKRESGNYRITQTAYSAD